MPADAAGNKAGGLRAEFDQARKALEAAVDEVESWEVRIADLEVKTSGWPGVEATHLLDNEVFAVCAPRYLEGRPPLTEPADLLGETLLNLVEYDRNWVTWEAWLREFGVVDKPARRGPQFNHYLLLIQAALGGQGIALGGGRLADDFLASGALVRPIAATLRSESGFYLSGT